MESAQICFECMRVDRLFEPGRTIAWGYIERLEYPWEALPHIKTYVTELGAGLEESGYKKVANDAWVHETATVAPSAYIGPFVIIGANAEVRHGAYIRGPAIVGENAVVGNSTELKNVILFDNVQVPHFNYVGDSILGYKAHMGAGVITCNVKNDKTLVTVACDGARIDTGLKKFGVILGDMVEVGCNSALNPGTVIGPRTSVYPLSLVRGFIKPDSIYKKQGEIVERI